jgi:RNA polymerase sigma factor (TIGR02999 family)
MEPVENGERDIESLLRAVEAEESGALDALVQAIYPDLKRLAHFQLRRERPGHTLNTTEIVHEAFLRIATNDKKGWTGRNHFMRAAARVMRHLLVDYARQRNTNKRGNGMAELTLQDEHSFTADHSMAVLDLDTAMQDMSAIDPRLESVVECRYFAGLSVGETADALGISTRSVERDWQRARAYILTAMGT